MTSTIKNSEKLQEKLNKNYEVMSRKTAQQLKDVKKKVKDLKHQIDKVSSGQTNNINISSANLNSQFYVQKEHFDATRKSIDDARTKSKDGSSTKLSVSEETNGNVVNLDLNIQSKSKIHIICSKITLIYHNTICSKYRWEECKRKRIKRTEWR